MTSMKTVKVLRTLTPLVHPRPKFFSPFNLWRSISKKPSRQMITNQVKENIIQGWLLFVLRSFFLAGFCFQYQLINFDWLYFDSISDFWWLYTLLCIVAQKYHKFFLLIVIHILVLILQSTCFIYTTHHACEQTKSSHVRFKLITSSIVGFSQQTVQFYFIFLFFIYSWFKANEITIYNKNSYVYIHANGPRELPNVEKMKIVN